MSAVQSAHYERTLLLLRALYDYGRRNACYASMKQARECERKALDRWAADVFRYAS